jgi:hypothetical protein
LCDCPRARLDLSQNHAHKPCTGEVGDWLIACDLYRACFAALLEPLPEEVNPMPGFLRRMYAMAGEEISAAKNPILFEHRDFIYATHLTLPLDF